MSKLIYTVAIAIVLCCLAGPARAANLSIEYNNKTSFNFVEIKTKMETPQGIRDEHLRVALPNGDSYRIVTPNGIKPVSMRLETLNGCLYFDDLSPLKAGAGDLMRLTVSYKDGVPALEQTDSDGKTNMAIGKAICFLNGNNRANAVSFEDAIKAGSLDKVRGLVKKSLPASTKIDSVLFEEDGGKTLIFPVYSFGLIGVGRAVALDSGAVAFSARLPKNDNALERIFNDLEKRGYRPWRAHMKGSDGDKKIEFASSGKTPAEDFATLRAEYLAARNKGGLREFSSVITNDRDFARVSAGKRPVSAPGMILYCGPGSIDMFWLPDITRAL